MKTYYINRFLLALCFSFASMIAMAQATRTWVSGVGDDANPCSRTAPCKTLAGAISKTATGGEINVLDPGGFGAVTITKSITIDGGGIKGSILSSGTNGIIINAPDGLVTIRNFSINGAGTTLGTNGIRVLAVKKLNVENCVLANFSTNGMDINPAPSGSTGTVAEIVIDNVTVHNAVTAINVSAGQVTVSNSLVSGCSIGIAVKSGASTYLAKNVISRNGTALQGPGTLTSAGNNSISGNTAQGITPTVVNQQ